MTPTSDKPDAVTQARKHLVCMIISMYHTTRLSEIPAEDHILSKAIVQDAFANLAAAPTGVDREAVERAIKATEYKYFGDYEMSDDQRAAVDTLVAVARALIATPQSVPAPEDMPTMRAAFRTTESCGGDKPSYTMTFKFRTMDDLHRADDEWRERKA